MPNLFDAVMLILLAQQHFSKWDGCHGEQT